MNLVYLEKLTLSSLPVLVVSRKKCGRVFYFDATPAALKIATGFWRLRLIRVKPKLAGFGLGKSQFTTRESPLIRAHEDLRLLTHEICEQQLSHNVLLRELGQHFNFKKLLLYFEKIVSSELEETIMLIIAAQSHSKKHFEAEAPIIYFLLPREPWTEQLRQYASRTDVKIIDFRRFSFLAFLPQMRRQILGLTKSLLKGLRNKLRVVKKEAVDSPPAVAKDSKHLRISALYTARTATFELTRRSGFMWLLRSNLPHSRVLLYFMRTNIPATPELMEDLRENDLDAVALSAAATTNNAARVWRPGRIYKQQRNQLMKLLARTFLKSLFRKGKAGLFYLVHMYNFFQTYAFWFDFFARNDIKIDINNQDYERAHIPMHMALVANDGVHISYQLSNIDISTFVLSVSADVMFAFGPDYHRVWEGNDSQIGNLVNCGYITDHAFEAVNDISVTLRRRLTGAGAKFIVAYFDENSSDERMTVIPNQRAAEIYARLLRLVLEDDGFGLILKPKQLLTLYERISSIAPLIEAAKATGRCIFMDEEPDLLPVTAAKAADLSVALLLGGTAGLESFLSGTPTVFLDLEEFYPYSLYDSGRGTVVFNDLGELMESIAKFRSAPESVKGFGDLSAWVEDRDPFKDGQASFRVGQYIGWLLEKFDAGATREEAMQYANKAYIESWGEENVVNMRNCVLEGDQDRRPVARRP